MKFEVDSEELKNIETNFKKSSDEMNEYLIYWRNQIDNLKQIWTGEDADIFYERMEAYLKKLDMLAETKNVFGKAFKQSYSVYEDKDEEFAKQLINENKQYDDEKFKNKNRYKITKEEGV